MPDGSPPHTSRLDGLANCATGLGDEEVDTRVNTRRTLSPQRSVYVLEAEYDQNWMAALETRTLPDAIFRTGVLVTAVAPDGFDVAAINTAINGSTTVEVDGSIKRDKGLAWYAWHLRVTGDKLAGAVLFPIVRDGLDPIEPLDTRRIESVAGWEVLDRSEIHPWVGASAGANVEPEYYVLTSIFAPVRDGGKSRALRPGEVIHRSRLYIHPGVELSRRAARARHWWGGSVLDRNWDQRRGVEEGSAYARTYMDRVSWLHLSMVQLNEILGAKDKLGNPIGEEAVRNRMVAIRKFARTFGIVVTDGGTEASLSANNQAIPARGADVLESVNESSGDLAALIEQDIINWSRGFGVPRSISLGDPATGIGGGTNGGDWQKFGGDVASGRRNWAEHVLNWQLRVAMAADDGPTGGLQPKSWMYEWAPVHIPTPKELAELSKLQADADRVRIDSDVVKASEVRTQRLVNGDATGALRVDPSDDEDDAGRGPVQVGIARAILEGAVAVGEGTLSPDAYAAYLMAIDDVGFPREKAEAFAATLVSGAAEVDPATGEAPTGDGTTPTEDAAPEPDEAEVAFSNDPRPADLTPSKALAEMIEAKWPAMSISSRKILARAKKAGLTKWKVLGDTGLSKRAVLDLLGLDHDDTPPA